MSGSLDLARVDELHLRITYSRMLEGPAHDVFLLETPTPATSEFEERPYLDILAGVLHAHGAAADPCVVHLNRTHRSWSPSAGEVEIVVALATGYATVTDPEATQAVASAFREVLGHVGAAEVSALTHGEVITEARLRVERAYPEVHADRLDLTGEEHVAARRLWSVDLVHSGTARFEVALGFVDGDPRTTHIRRLPFSEVVDSVGETG